MVSLPLKIQDSRFNTSLPYNSVQVARDLFQCAIDTQKQDIEQNYDFGSSMQYPTRDPTSYNR